MSENLIEFNNISKFFGKVIALKDVTMKLTDVIKFYQIFRHYLLSVTLFLT
jgi:hypothetical protein